MTKKTIRDLLVSLRKSKRFQRQPYRRLAISISPASVATIITTKNIDADAPIPPPHSANGFTARTPSKSWPEFRSSESTSSQPRVRAASTMAASQYESCQQSMVASDSSHPLSASRNPFRFSTCKCSTAQPRANWSSQSASKTEIFSEAKARSSAARAGPSLPSIASATSLKKLVRFGEALPRSSRPRTAQTPATHADDMSPIPIPRSGQQAPNDNASRRPLSPPPHLFRIKQPPSERPQIGPH